MKNTREFTVAQGSSFEQAAAVWKEANEFFNKVSALGDADKFTKGRSTVVVRYDVEPQDGQYGEVTKQHYDTGLVDSKGRKVGFVAVYRDNGQDFRCYVQNTRDGEEFGVPQRSKSFKSAAAAKAYGHETATARVAKRRA